MFSWRNLYHKKRFSMILESLGLWATEAVVPSSNHFTMAKLSSAILLVAIKMGVSTEYKEWAVESTWDQILQLMKF